jgi:predicted extracellular nuclease
MPTTASLLARRALALGLCLSAAPLWAGGDTVLLSEIVVTPTNGEFVEILNPTSHYIELSDVYITDATFTSGGLFYYKVVTGAGAGGGTNADFHARFPDGAVIGPGERQTLAIANSANFLALYGANPTYELFEDAGSPDAIPDMRPAYPGSIDTSAPSGITNAGEIVVLYQWDGASDLVQDLDYALWGDKDEAVDKTGVAIDGPDAGSGTSTYLADTTIGTQAVIATGAHTSGNSFQRTNNTEGTEVATGGNGLTGNDETSENVNSTWATAARNPVNGARYGALLLSEIATHPTAAEFIEIWNPNPFAVDLADVYLTDATAGSDVYYKIVTGSGAGGGAAEDFHARFPAGATIAPGAYQTIAIGGSAGFFTAYGSNPTYELFEDGAPDAVPDMRTAFASSIDTTPPAAELDESGEVVVLYHWNGASDLVGDLDYALWGDKAEAVTKTGVTIDGPDGGSGTSAYRADTAIVSQQVIDTVAHAGGGSYTRVNGFEPGETASGGNGVDQDDETSEDLDESWDSVATATPGTGALPAILLTIADASQAEGNGGTSILTFTVSLSAPAPSGGVSFNIATADGTATVADDDYEAASTIGATIPATQTTYLFDVTINGDTEAELDETFTVTLSNVVASGVSASDPVATGTLTNDDGLEIFQIQGDGAASPLDGQIATTRNNVVTAVGPQGFFIQTPTARDDNDIDTSNGVYVFTSSAPTVTVGQLVDVTGTVDEFFEFTEITAPTVTVVGSGSLPAAVAFNASVPSPNPTAPSCAIEYECYEGMRVQVAQGVINGPSQFFGTDPVAEPQVTAGPRAFREPGVDFPGVGGSIPTYDGNPQVFELDPDRLGLANASISSGSTFTATGVLGYEFNDWELWPTSLSVTPPTQPVPAGPIRAKKSDEILIGSLNMFRFFDDVDDPTIDDTDEDATTTAEYDCRRAKFIAHIGNVLRFPDVLAVQEVENLAVLQDLAADIVTGGGPSYAAFLSPGNDVGGIDVGFLVRNTVAGATATQLGAAEVFSCDGNLLNDRPPLRLQGTYTGGGANFPFAVIAVHQRSRGSIDTASEVCAANPSVQRVRQKRLEQSQSAAAMVQSFQTANPNVPLVMIGDFNAFEFTDGYIDVIGQIRGVINPAQNQLSATPITNPVMHNEVFRAPADDRYSYIFDGSAQVLDHALTTQAAVRFVSALEFGRGNADSPIGLVDQGCSPSNPTLLPLRPSDHDGVALYLQNGVGFVFTDGFETGNSTRWSATVP